MDKNEFAALLESLCDRPFAAEPQRPQVADAGAGESAPQPSRPEAPGAAAIQADDPGQAAADLASVLSGTATPAQCQAFQEAATTSSAVRLEAQSALAFLDSIDAAPLAAPAHLVAQSLVSAGGAPSPARPGIWSRLMRRPGRQAAAACAVMLMAGGVSWSLLRHGDLTGDGAPVPPARAPQAVGLPKVVEPAPAPVASPEPVAPMPPAAPAGSEFSTQSELPARPVAPLSVPPLAVRPAAPAFAPVPEPPPSLPSPTQALTEPCGPRSVVASIPEPAPRSRPKPPSPRRASRRESRLCRSPIPAAASVRSRPIRARSLPRSRPPGSAGRIAAHLRAPPRRPPTRPPPPPSAQPRTCRRVSLERASSAPSLTLKGGGWRPTGPAVGRPDDRLRRRVGVPPFNRSGAGGGTPTRPASRVDSPFQGEVKTLLTSRIRPGSRWWPWRRGRNRRSNR